MLNEREEREEGVTRFVTNDEQCVMYESLDVWCAGHGRSVMRVQIAVPLMIIHRVSVRGEMCDIPDAGGAR